MAVLIAVEPATLTVEAGGIATTQVRVRNQGSRVDEFQLTVLGAASSWATIDPPSVNLFPRTEGTATVTFRPPRASVPAAGTVPFGVLARSIAEPDSSAAEEGTITVGPFVALSKELMPRTSHGRRVASHTLHVRNDGNAPARLAARAVDPDGEIGLVLEPTSAEIAAGATAELRATARAKAWLIFGTPKRYPFSIDVTEPTAGTESLPAVFEQRSLLPTWLLTAAGLVVALLAIGLASGILKPTGGDTSSPGPSAVAGGQPTTAAEATAPGDEPTDPPAVDPTQTPGPTATVFGTAELAISGTGFDDIYTSDTVGALYSQGKLVINFPVTINGAPCLGRVFVPAATGAGTYPLGEQSQGAFAYGDFECGGGALFHSVGDGELRIDQLEPTISGHVGFGGTDDIDTISFSGEFRNVPITTP